MIYQISPIKSQTESLPGINRDLIRARHIQAQVKERAGLESLPDQGYLYGPFTAGPYLVPVTRWIE